jgi:hypothetical protein
MLPYIYGEEQTYLNISNVIIKVDKFRKGNKFFITILVVLIHVHIFHPNYIFSSSQSRATRSFKEMMIYRNACGALLQNKYSTYVLYTQYAVFKVSVNM